MIMFFTEQDLVSFGEYMISQVREDSIKKLEISEDEKLERLSNVTNQDLLNWTQLINQIRQENAN